MEDKKKCAEHEKMTKSKKLKAKHKMMMALAENYKGK